ncbi:hypothetical protein DFP73DRAFT_588139 [Morchella snyderi]|nr:hypothetical protein DFP73DRAFT_588139 [Morchella snyderi]
MLMADSRSIIVKERWRGSYTNFQASYGLDMPPEDIVEGNATLDAMQKADERDLEAKDSEAKKYDKSVLKGIVAEQVAEKYRVTPTGNPEIDLIIAMGLRALNNELVFGDTFEPGESTSSNLVGSAGEAGATKSKRQRKRERQRESAKKR